MNRLSLEKYQALIYLKSICYGLILGIVKGNIEILEVMLWPILGVLLYATFTQVPLAHLRKAFTQWRFMVVAVIGNFMLLPFVAWRYKILL